MSNASHLPKNATWLSPYITVDNVTRSAHFYQKAFQFQCLELAPGEDGTDWHGEMSYQNQLIMLGKSGAYGGTTRTPQQTGVESPINLYLYCDNVDAFYEKAILNGATSVSPPEDMFWGDRTCRLKDLDGYIWSFATFSGERN